MLSSVAHITLSLDPIDMSFFFKEVCWSHVLQWLESVDGMQALSIYAPAIARHSYICM